MQIRRQSLMLLKTGHISENRTSLSWGWRLSLDPEVSSDLVNSVKSSLSSMNECMGQV